MTKGNARADVCTLSPLSPPLHARLALFCHFRVEGVTKSKYTMCANMKQKLFYTIECTESLNERYSDRTRMYQHLTHPITPEPVTIPHAPLWQGTGLSISMHRLFVCLFSAGNEYLNHLLLSDKAVFGADILPGCCAPAQALVNHARDGCDGCGREAGAAAQSRRSPSH